MIPENLDDDLDQRSYDKNVIKLKETSKKRGRPKKISSMAEEDDSKQVQPADAETDADITKQIILDFIKEKKSVTAATVATHTGLSRVVVKLALDTLNYSSM